MAMACWVSELPPFWRASCRDSQETSTHLSQSGHMTSIEPPSPPTETIATTFSWEGSQHSSPFCLALQLHTCRSLSTTLCITCNYFSRCSMPRFWLHFYLACSLPGLLRRLASGDFSWVPSHPSHTTSPTARIGLHTAAI